MYTATTENWPLFLAGSMALMSSASVVLDDEIICPDLPIVSGSITKSSDGRQVQQTLSMTVADDTGTLQAGPRAPLAPYGQQIVVRAGLAYAADLQMAEMIPMGVFDVDGSDPDESAPWRMYPNGRWLITGGQVTATAADPLARVAEENFPSTVRPAAGGTVRSELQRILRHRMPVAALTGFAGNTVIPDSLVYDESRLSTVLALGEMAGGICWSDRNGALGLLVGERQTAGVWDVAVGNPDDPEDDGALVTFRPSLTFAGTKNAVIVTSEDSLGRPLRGVAYETSGPLRWGGPGYFPLRVENRLLRTNRACKAHAEQLLRRLIADRTITVQVSCLPNLAVDPLDTIMLRLPDLSIPGLVTSITYPLTAGAMTMQVAIPMRDWLVIPTAPMRFPTLGYGYGVGGYGSTPYGR